MKTSHKLIIAAAIVAICILPSVLSIKCIVCNSLTDGTSRCGHGKDVDPSLEKDCDTQAHEDGVHGTPYTMCRKITTWIDFDVNNNTATERVTRKCGYLTSNYDNKCYYRGGFGGRQQVCSCSDKPSCNSVDTFRVNPVMMVIAGVAVLLAGIKY